MLISGTDHDVGRSEILSDQNAGLVIIVRPVDELPVSGNLDPFEIGAGDEVGHARNGIRTIGGCGAILQYFHALEGEHRDEIGIRSTVAWFGEEALPVHQDECAFTAKAAQVDRADALAAAGGILVRIAEHRTDRRQGLDEFERTVDAPLAEFIDAEDVDRENTFFGRTADEGPGHHNRAGVLRRGGLIRLSRSRGILRADHVRCKQGRDSQRRSQEVSCLPIHRSLPIAFLFDLILFFPVHPATRRPEPYGARPFR